MQAGISGLCRSGDEQGSGRAVVVRGEFDCLGNGVSSRCGQDFRA